MEEHMIQTPYGVFSGVTTAEHHHDGTLRSIQLEEQNVILTHAGALIPFYGEETVRRKNKASVTFHKNGMIKAVALEELTEVETPIGALPAELITFYETGELHRAFPLDGKLSGFWSEEDERALNIPLSFDLGFASFTALVSGICFYRSGQIRSVTLFPGEVIDVATRLSGSIKVRHGFSLYEDGTLRSLEPAAPIVVQTPIGTVTAYDVNSHGINADTNSLCFDVRGRVIRLVTSSDIITVSKAGGSIRTFAPAMVSEEEDGALVPIPLDAAFGYDIRRVTLSGQCGLEDFSFDDAFEIHGGRPQSGGCTGHCQSCGSCGKQYGSNESIFRQNI
jgi:hypothetical protein